MSTKSRVTSKERGLIKGSLRRVFSRSELRLKALEKNAIAHIDPNRPRVTKWSFCSVCGLIEPRYKMQVDHEVPVIGILETLENISWDDLIEERLWCEAENLIPICKPCHSMKTKFENKKRRDYKRGKL